MASMAFGARYLKTMRWMRLCKLMVYSRDTTSLIAERGLALAQWAADLRINFRGGQRWMKDSLYVCLFRKKVVMQKSKSSRSKIDPGTQTIDHVEF